jgi:hypothetical protein
MLAHQSAGVAVVDLGRRRGRQTCLPIGVLAMAKLEAGAKRPARPIMVLSPF